MKLDITSRNQLDRVLPATRASSGRSSRARLAHDGSFALSTGGYERGLST